MDNDIKNKKKVLKRSFRKASKRKIKKSSSRMTWTKVIIISSIIIILMVFIGVISWVNSPSPHVNMTEKDEIFADFDGANICIEYLDTYFYMAPVLTSIEPIIFDYFPSQYQPTFSSSTIAFSITENYIQFFPDEIQKNTALSWDYKLNITDKDLTTWISNTNIEIKNNHIPNNTETTVNISTSFKALKDFTICRIRLGFKNSLQIGNSSVIIKPISQGYHIFSSGFYYEKFESSVQKNSIIKLEFRINVTLNSGTPLDILNGTSQNDYRNIYIKMNNKLINNFFTDGFTESSVTFTGFASPPPIVKNNIFAINLEFKNITLYPV
ncbi:MAG: hypothetical protein ACTSWR_12240 [Candidatus Helarchaeota archaeon]